MTTIHSNHAYDEEGRPSPITTQFQFKNWADARGVPYRELSGGRLVCLDLSLCPPAIQEQFDEQGFWGGIQTNTEVTNVSDETAA